jgi:vacuolar-type H+-ATPase subunit B/Vma2
MEVGWRILHHLPRSELHRLSDAQIEAHIPPTSPPAAAP